MCPPPYQPSLSAHVQQMPRYRRNCESQLNPEADTTVCVSLLSPAWLPETGLR